MRYKAITFLVALGFASPAIAADMPASPTAPQVFEDLWSGAFVGLHAGYGWGNSDITNSSPPGPPARTTALDPDGFLGGIQAGYNWRRDSFVFGAIADVSFASMSDTYINVPPPGPRYTATADINWMATLRARAGWLLSENFLLYAHGGLAFADIDGSVVAINAMNVVGLPWNAQGSDSGFGWIVGAGVEYKLSAKYSVFAEYSYADFGSYMFPNLAPPGPTNVFFQDTDVSLVKFGLNMSF
ncbi:MAG: outer membrane protein [Flavobacteriaceae bacterium]